MLLFNLQSCTCDHFDSINANDAIFFQDAKEHLAALADKLGSSLTDIDV